ncbi:disease resistance protein [Salix suchowensis]|nr:disease resistance protein [Salix suchowensis]
MDKEDFTEKQQQQRKPLLISSSVPLRRPESSRTANRDYTLGEKPLFASILVQMEGVPPSFMDDDVNQLDLQAPVDNFNMSELPSSFNQSSMLCNYQAGQKTLVDNDVINYSIQQTMTAMGGLDGTSSSWINQNGPNWAQTPSRQEEAAAAARIQVSKITSSNSLHRGERDGTN